VNLRKFHLVFITCSIALALFVGVWTLTSGALEGALRIAASLGAFAVAAGLVVYEAWFAAYSGRER
jgi:hypothetical protein